MNRLFGLIIILIVVAAGLTVWLLSLPRVSTATNESAKPQSNESPKPQLDQSNTPVNLSSIADHTRESNSQHAEGVYEAGDLRWKWWDEMRKRDPRFEWKMPINFYGQVVDESDHPVVGAIITLTWTDLSPDGSSSVDVVSDSSGRFSLTGQQGKRLVINNIAKDGYYLSKTQNDFSYEYAAFFEDIFHEADPDKPVIFRMRRKGIIEPLVYRDTLYLLKPDGTAHYLDLRTGLKSVGGQSSGDLKVQLTRSISSNPERPNWSLTIEGVGAGGLIESAEEFMFEAPTNGYVNQVRVTQQETDPDYQSQIYRNYYIKLADGKTFARIETHLFSKYNNEAAINVVVYLNPSGSRNLEYD